MSRPVFDAIILGGGVAGLWSLARLRAAGRHAVLLETAALGAGQTGWAQGIIHGGIKYALTGDAGRASRAVSGMPAAWSAAFAGQGPVDLRAAHRLAPDQLLWTTPGIVSRVAGAAASHAIRSSVHALPKAERPPPFDLAPAGLTGIEVYRVAEEIFDPVSVVSALAEPVRDHCGQIHAVTNIAASDEGVAVTAAAAGAELRLHAHRLILTAGAGNEVLLAMLGCPAAPRMQRRPLHMVYARGPLPTVFGHCVTAAALPRLTITTHPGRSAGERVWAIGGTLAERGVNQTREEVITEARRELAACLPWLTLDPAVTFSAGRIDRAEGLTPDGSRPDEPVMIPLGPVLAGWPTKLAFAPLVADRVLDFVSTVPPATSHDIGLTHIPTCPLARPPWENEGWLWT